MNKKGFALSITVYGLFGLMLTIIFYILWLMSTSRMTTSALTSEIENCAGAHNACRICKEDGSILSTLINFQKISGIGTALDDDGTSYYYTSGDNNYVKFGKDTSNNDLIWKILRINGNGTIRLILNDTIPFSPIKDINGNDVQLNVGDVIDYYEDADDYINNVDNTNLAFLNIGLEDTNCATSSYVSYKYLTNNPTQLQTSYFLNEIKSSIYGNYISETFEQKDNIYTNSINNWYSNISLNTSKITDSGTFCAHSTTTGEGVKNFTYSDNFKCEGANDTSINLLIGLPSYQEVNKIKNSININKSYITSDFKKEDEDIVSGWNTYNLYSLYYVNASNAINNDFVYTRASVSHDYPFFIYDRSDKPSCNQLYKYYSEYNIKYVAEIRPVINLKNDTVFTGNGTVLDPYVVSE